MKKDIRGERLSKAKVPTTGEEMQVFWEPEESSLTRDMGVVGDGLE